MFGQNNDYKNKRKLAAQQQAYAVENATTAYQRQMELTANQALLARNGASAAGLSVAGSDGSGVSAASVSQASPNDGGSLPSSAEYMGAFTRGVDSLMGSIAQLRENAVADAQVSKLLSEKRGQDLSNSFNQMTLLDRAVQQGYITKEQGGKAMSAVAQGLADNKNLVPQSDAKTIIDQATASTANEMSIAQLENERAKLVTERERARNLGKSTEVFDKKIEVLDSQIELNKSQTNKNNIDASLAPGIAASQINVNNANAKVANAQAQGIGYDNIVKAIETQRKVDNKPIEDKLYKKALEFKEYSLTQRREILKNQVIKSKLDNLSKNQHEELMRYLQDPVHADDSFIKRWPARALAFVFEALDSIGGVASQLVSKGAVGNKKPVSSVNSDTTYGYFTTTAN